MPPGGGVMGASRSDQRSASTKACGNRVNAWLYAAAVCAPLITVVGDYSGDLYVSINFHKLACFCILLIHVVQDNAGKPAHHVEKFKLEIWVRFKSSPEVRA